MQPEYSAATLARFWSKVDKSGECWLWTAYRYPNGYGHFSVRHAPEVDQWYSHRLAYTLVSGPIPAGMSVLHKCDNPPCCNPDHLFLGTQADNMRDMWAKGRGPSGERNTAYLHPDRVRRGERHHMAKLTAEAVLQIRAQVAAGAKHAAVAEAFGIQRREVGRIARRERWASV